MEKRKNTTDPEDKIPLFLRKTFNMITACDTSIASWSDDGLSFAVKDVDLLASKILCQYFKHNNFSSFVRQLNLYGFRKLKSIDNDKIDAKYWKFKHDYFQRGRLDLLSQVRKSNQSAESAEKAEVEKLKAEVGKLRGEVATIRAQLGGVTLLINSLGVNNSEQPAPAQHYVPSMITTTTKREAETTGTPEQGIFFASSAGSTPNAIPTTFSNSKKQRVIPTIPETNLASAAITTTSVTTISIKEANKIFSQTLNGPIAAQKPPSLPNACSVVPEVVFPSAPGDDMNLSTGQTNHLNEQSPVTDDELLDLLVRNNKSASED